MMSDEFTRKTKSSVFDLPDVSDNGVDNGGQRFTRLRFVMVRFQPFEFRTIERCQIGCHRTIPFRATRFPIRILQDLFSPGLDERIHRPLAFVERLFRSVNGIIGTS